MSTRRTGGNTWPQCLHHLLVAEANHVVWLLPCEVSSDLDVSVRKARRKATELAAQFPNLSEDERAIITLYTMEMYPPEQSMYWVLNEALRAQRRERVKPWRDIILLLLTALKKLPPVQDRVVHRAVKLHARDLGTLVFDTFGFHEFSCQTVFLAVSQSLGN